MLLVFGLVVSGSTVRAKELFARAVAPSCSVEPLSGSETRPSRPVLLDGARTVARRCVDRTRGPEAVRRHYEAVAARESQLGKGRGPAALPWIASSAANGDGVVIWTDAASGKRRGAIVRGASGGTDYVLLESESDIAAPSAGAGLPGGVELLKGAKPVLTLDDQGNGFAMVDVPGAASGAAARVVEGLAARGFAVDVDAARAMAEVTGSQSRATIPFNRPGTRGVAIVAPDGGRTRVTYLLRAE